MERKKNTTPNLQLHPCKYPFRRQNPTKPFKAFHSFISFILKCVMSIFINSKQNSEFDALVQGKSHTPTIHWIFIYFVLSHWNKKEREINDWFLILWLQSDLNSVTRSFLILIFVSLLSRTEIKFNSA